MATARQRKAAQKILENLGLDKPRPVGEILREIGYSNATSQTPTLVTESKGFKELIDQYLPDEDVLSAHKSLLNSTRIEHMVFPVYKDPDAGVPEEGDIPEELEPQPHGGALKRRHAVTEGASLSDSEIEDMLDEVNCKVRKIVHGETARHVYYWAPDSLARKAAIDMAYKIKGRITNKVEVDDKRTNPFAELTTEELRKLAEK